ncbi:acireductone synthase [Streptomyces sp. NRRL S-87]|uniref:acireductone synthase n=1 Tax=Streptomyces sp. NRRL S-87 TaxID=1463920 RepID=UPI0004BF4AE3|nr:acireductone synthase [Streptomyces sp. NRRL S-87]
MTAVAAVVLDIEGTVGSASHVRDVLFPFARERFDGWFAAHRGTPEWSAVLTATGFPPGAGDPGPAEAAAVARLTSWTDADVKAPALKTLQGLIWAEGYAAGALTGHVYPEVPGALRRWYAAGLPVHIYSSGSVAAQRDWFAHTAHGDLTGLLAGHFDLETAGGKRDPDSYRAIARALGTPPESLLFLSDTQEELGAAAAAGWRTVGVRRPGDPAGPEVPGHTTIDSLAHPALGETWQKAGTA